MNKHPVIFVSFKGVEGFNFESAYETFKNVIAGVCRNFIGMMNKGEFIQQDLDNFNDLLSRTAALEDMKASLKTIMELIYTIYGKKVVLLIDEYDVPVSKAYAKGGKVYYDKMFLIRGVLDNALKTNPYLEFGVVTGCLGIVKESIFTGVNNFKPFSILDNMFSTYFGFTDDEVQKMLTTIGHKDKLPIVREWYDEYVFGKKHMYCP